MHPYQLLPLFATGVVLAIWLIGVHALMLAKPAAVQGFLKKFPRDQALGQILLGIGLAWFWLLIAPDGMGKLSALAMDLGEFNGVKGLLRILVPASLILVSMSVRDFLAVRALGLLGLMVAAPLLGAAFLKDPQSRLLIPIYAYAVLTASLFFVGMPYLFRDAVTWVTADQKRWTLVSVAGLVYGIATLVCAFAFWRGY
ncbi:hypothetical protein JIN84_03355 [Luteolibacter yonseiensis]|uniref:Uncharacterized protein n=1 Tax=Luteolibacter yonseiensis TaxID=1144680 RepID=A0A934R0R6_9BACT|nr:hypothetical protein [Luteolibacter yonseiensis]MBK1814634.1 hypothetical protein [Luteolibacter yonseiensis]